MTAAVSVVPASSPVESLAMMMRALKLPSFARYAGEIAQKAEREGWTFGQYLHHLAELEIHERRRRRVERYLKDSDLLPEKTLVADVNYIHPSATTRSPHRPPWLTASPS